MTTVAPSMGVTSILAKYFNVGEGKRSLAEFQQELKALSTDEKAELAALAAPLLGMSVKA